MSTDSNIQEFSCEAVTWQQLSHPNVLPFFGVFHLERNPPRICLACPWMENGNVVQFLADQAPDTDCISLVSKISEVWHCIHNNCFIQSLDIAQGLKYLHSENIIHGDLKGVCFSLSILLQTTCLTILHQLNILVSRMRRACLADFGLSTAADSKYMSTTRPRGTLRWQAPELLLDVLDSDSPSPERRNTFATDVYAFALVCYEASFNCTVLQEQKCNLTLDVLRRNSIPRCYKHLSGHDRSSKG
jgi:serine/threonine protein kinase